MQVPSVPSSSPSQSSPSGPAPSLARLPPRRLLPHTITVSGSGKVTIVPDVARITLGVTINKPTVKAVREAGAKAMTDVIAAIKGLGVADADIKTTDISLYPQYGNGSPQKIVGYQINEQVLVTVRDLDKAGDVVDAATAQGANAVNGISFESGDPVKAQDDARAAAVAAAKVSAQAMAKAAMSHSAASCRSRTPPELADLVRPGCRRDEGPRDPGPARDQDLTATVTVVFAIDWAGRRSGLGAPAVDFGLMSRGRIDPCSSCSPHASRGTRHMISNSLPSGSEP